MAEAAKSKLDMDEKETRLDKQKLREQLTEWHRQVVRSFRGEDEREREELLDELEENMPIRLSEVEQCLRMFLEDGSDSSETYNLFLKAHDMALGFENASTLDGISADQLHRLNKLLEPIKALHLLECRWSVNIIHFLRVWSADLEEWQSDSRFEDDLDNVLKSFEDWEDTAYVWPGILDKIRDILKRCEEERWPRVMLDIFHFMARAVQLFNTRLGEARAALNMGDSNKLADRLKQMQSSLKEVLDTETIIPDLVVVNISINPDGKDDEEIPLLASENLETDVVSVTRRPVERLKDLLIKDSISKNIVDLNDRSGTNLVRETGGNMDIFISHDAPKSYIAYHAYLKEDDDWTRIPASVQNDRLCVTYDLPTKTLVFFTSMKNDTNATLDPDQEYRHICPENQEVRLGFTKGTVTSTQMVHITLRECNYPMSEIAGYSDIVCIQHDEDFLKPVTVTMPMTMIGEIDITQCDLHCVHIGDDGLTINKEVKVEVLRGNICRFETTKFGWNVLHATKKMMSDIQEAIPSLETFTKQLQWLHDPGPHNIILFVSKRYDGDTWLLHAEIVPEAEFDNTVEQRRNKMGLFELPKCASPSLNIRGIQQIAVLGENCSLGPLKGAKTGNVVINITRGGRRNFINFTITMAGAEKIGIIHFKAVDSEEDLHHTTFDQEDMDEYNLFHETPTPDKRVSPKQSDKETVHVSEKFFGEASMLCLMKKILTGQLVQLAVSLGIKSEKFDDLKEKHRNDSDGLRLELITHWLGSQSCSDQERVSKLCSALKDTDLNLIAEIVNSVFKKNRPLQKTDFD